MIPPEGWERKEAMPESETNDDFGEWRIAPDGTAHSLIAGECLCGVKVKKWGGPPVRKPVPGTTTTGTLLTPLCLQCIDLNIARWQGKGTEVQGAPLTPQRSFWWRQPTRTLSTNPKWPPPFRRASGTPR